MRRQARISKGGALVARSASALQVWLWLLIFIFQNEFRISRSIQPGYLDFDNLPETNFTCTGKVIGGYYADTETSCQMFHVCTVGQQEEPMDIKFLCLNGTVFDQETRVCERVDEVDCTKSEKFYSLNLELYGSTAPPIIQADQSKPQTQPTEQSKQKAKPSHEEADPSIEDSPTTTQDKTIHSDFVDTTDDPIQDFRKDEPKKTQDTTPTHPSLTSPDNEDDGDEYQEEEIDSESPDYDEDYSHPSVPTTTTQSSTSTPFTTTKPAPISTITILQTPILHLITSPAPVPSSLSPPAHSSLTPSAPALPTSDPAYLTPQEFIYRHRGPGSEAISFQRQSFRPADGVYITHAPPQQFDHFQYESSRTAPRPSAPRPVPFVQRPQPSPFRPTTLDPRDQLLRPGPTSQPSERHETSIKHRPQTHPQPLPAQRPLPFNPYYYERKRSDDTVPEDESSLSARSVAPPVIRGRVPSKPKSPPRVIVTASASVSDSNGKRLNYTVGNVVSAVKPIVPINYDDYKESDLIFDPFFLDVPKLEKRRKTRSNSKRRIFTVPGTAAAAPSSSTSTKLRLSTASPITSRATTTERSHVTTVTTTTTAAWNPDDYVDDNYEPHAYVPPVSPLAIIFAVHDRQQFKHDRQEVKGSRENTRGEPHGLKPEAATAGSSHSAPAASPSPPPPPPLAAAVCVPSLVTRCRV